MIEECGVCCEKINKSTRKDIVCIFCDYKICRSCFQKYITDTPTEPNCMNCKKIFNLEFITDNCTNVFVTKNFKSHRETILFDRERSLLPETQPYVVVELQKRELQKQINLLDKKGYDLNHQIRSLYGQKTVLYDQIANLTVENYSTDERKKFIRKCPMSECRGFLSSQWKCGSCESKICNKCNEEKQENHVCIPENVASMEFLNKDTKPCPHCGTMIFKISGCNQIFCVDCHTAWDWNTSKIITGVIHNPHYYEFLNRGGIIGRNNGDIPCGGLPFAHEIRNMVNIIYLRETTQHILLQIHQCVSHIEQVELRNINNFNFNDNRKLRIKYLLKEIDEPAFKAILQSEDKKFQKITAFRNIYQMFVDVSSDIFRQILINYDKYLRDGKIVKIISFNDENIEILKNLINYFNENLKKIGKMYNCVYPGITTTKYLYVHNLETANLKE